MTGAALVAGARTPVCPAGGRLRDVGVQELALAAASGLAAARNLVAASAFGPGVDDGPSSGLAAGLASALGIDGRAVEVGGLDAAGLEALALAALLAGTGAGATFAVGVDSASRAPYLVPGLRWGAREGGARVHDPLAQVIDAARGRAALAGVSRADVDGFAARSHAARAAGHPAESVVPVAGVDADAAPPGARDADALATLKPLFDPSGTVTAGAVALPSDGAAAALVMPAADAPAGALALLCVAATAPEALDRAAIAPAELAAVELHEGSAAEALALAAQLGLGVERVNAAGGAIGLGHPVAATGVIMALRLHARLAALGGGAGLVAAPGCALAVRLEPGH